LLKTFQTLQTLLELQHRVATLTRVLMVLYNAGWFNNMPHLRDNSLPLGWSETTLQEQGERSGQAKQPVGRRGCKIEEELGMDERNSL